MKEAVAEEPINPTVKNIQILIVSLLDSISRVQIFKGKWSLIRTKLTALETHLLKFSSAAGYVNPLSVDLFHSLSATCSAAVSLADICHSPTPPGGKLKTQNDVDSISAKLDNHINDLEVLNKSGVVTESAAVSFQATVSNVSSSSKRESVRAESRNLMTRLQIGSAESKVSALDSLLGLLQEDDKNVLIAVAQGIVPILVRLLDSSSSEIKERTVAAIAKISTVDSGKHVLLAEGLVLLNHLLRVLESGSVFAKEKSCIALQALSHSKENARAIGSRGGITSLLEICQSGTPNSQAISAGVLRNLAAFPEVKEHFMEEDAVVTILALSNSGTALAHENSIGCLCNLISGDDDLKLFLAREGGIECVKNFWDSAPTPRNLEVVVQMVSILASSPLISEVLVANGFLNHVVGVLNCGVLGVRVAAANAVYDLAYSVKTQKELGKMGCISLLSRMLDGKAIEEKEAAAKTLSKLMVYAGNRRMFRKEEKGITSAVKLLDPLVLNLDKKYPISILTSIVHYKKSRKQMVATGARSYLQKLVEMNVDGAKKLYDNLGHGKLWGVFART
ncbi:Armadillo repeat VAC8 [Olea europaea subsp. europaea]|uniref:Armadillo repeat VAC8 n=1 Tax=Olea europaea subsp. europaea TaxID=158383 RepID=A0A8S0PBZ4_OLEEU|nr:Armadillo repeat VAC8 [Olea europaea subsp. europaea]